MINNNILELLTSTIRFEHVEHSHLLEHAVEGLNGLERVLVDGIELDDFMVVWCDHQLTLVFATIMLLEFVELLHHTQRYVTPQRTSEEALDFACLGLQQHLSEALQLAIQPNLVIRVFLVHHTLLQTLLGKLVCVLIYRVCM